MRVLVLGGTGFLGRHIRDAFRAAGHDAVPLSRSTDPAVDLSGPKGCARLAGLVAESGAQVVVNAAGRAWRASDEEMTRANAELVARVSEELSALPRAPRLVHLGSVHEYGPGTPGTSTAEDRPARPVTPYGRSKLLGTRHVLHASRSAGLDGTVLRVANVSGPGTPPGSLLRTVADHLVEAARVRARGGTADPLRFGRLDARRDFVDARDVADAVLAAACAPSADVAGRIFNIGRGEAVPVRRLVGRLVALSGLAVPVFEDGDPDSPRPAAEWQRLDISRARRVLNWQPARDLDTSLKDLLEAA
uniref:NAD(P)-dependent oxidoreductase n=1 Tax=Streptomyces sp. NBC_01401 TaxID=2903854 RepID=A0AAU3GQP2_9ACTN